MPRYTFSCIQCGFQDTDFTDYMPIGAQYSNCPLCSSRMKRAASFYFTREVGAHFNPAIGHRISNKHEYKDGLKRAEEEQSIRTGVDAHYIEVDMGDTKTLGVTDEGLEGKFRQLDAMGKKRPKV